MSDRDRYIYGGDGSHWDGCHETHWDCRIAWIEQQLATERERVRRYREAVSLKAVRAVDREVTLTRRAMEWVISAFDGIDAELGKDGSND